jgi:hypothetical protein
LEACDALDVSEAVDAGGAEAATKRIRRLFASEPDVPILAGLTECRLEVFPILGEIT